ncbi:hypothetical protein VTJ49DRAFT_6006 [Mycothermus thermophilus]|uniref:Inositol phoshorylceramide synthase regulatory subunit kei1 n=1 Tax=Humicola insolens TaxID=85995 RepID=A0ABR3VJW5_HUMIN
MSVTSPLSWLRVPRPKSFLGFISLQTGTELVSIALLINKATGIYGLLTLFTGYALSALQVTAYLGSVFVLATLAVCIPQVRRRSPLHCLILAWVYAIDTVVSTAYTAAFATSWYVAGVHAVKAPSTSAEDDGSAAGNARRADATPSADSDANAPDTAFSIGLVVAFTLIRFYFSLVVMAYARMVILRYVDERMGDTEEAPDTAADPFAPGAPLGEGWKGRLGRVLLSVGRGYWLGGKKEDEEWARQVNSKFRSSRE